MDLFLQEKCLDLPLPFPKTPDSMSVLSYRYLPELYYAYTSTLSFVTRYRRTLAYSYHLYLLDLFLLFRCHLFSYLSSAGAGQTRPVAFRGALDFASVSQSSLLVRYRASSSIDDLTDTRGNGPTPSLELGDRGERLVL